MATNDDVKIRKSYATKTETGSRQHEYNHPVTIKLSPKGAGALVL